MFTGPLRPAYLGLKDRVGRRAKHGQRMARARRGLDEVIDVHTLIETNTQPLDALTLLDHTQDSFTNSFLSSTMHSIVSRLNNVTAFLSSCTMALLVAIALSSLLFNAEPQGSLNINSVKVFNVKAQRYPHHKQEQAFVSFNITADLTPLFHWNTKQLFLYLEAEYINSQGIKNEVVIWDRIVRRKEDAIINIGGKNKYHFHDISASFKKAPSSEYALKYNVMPYVGALAYGEAARTGPIDFPKVEKRV